jgi:hypothetical protein
MLLRGRSTDDGSVCGSTTTSTLPTRRIRRWAVAVALLLSLGFFWPEAAPSASSAAAAVAASASEGYAAKIFRRVGKTARTMGYVGDKGGDGDRHGRVRNT